jgi:hypothetical protein
MTVGNSNRRGFSAALEARVVERLRAGQDPAELQTELHSRLSRDAAEALVARALEQVGPERGTVFRPATASSPPRRDRVDTALAVFACLWAAVVIVQNVMIVQTVVGSGFGWVYPAFRRGLVTALFNLSILGAGGAWWLARPNRAASFAFAAAVLFAFPFGRVLIDTVAEQRVTHLETMASLSALLSYAAAAAIGVRQHRRQAAEARTRGVERLFD